MRSLGIHLKYTAFIIIGMLPVLAVLIGCSEDVFLGSQGENHKPYIYLTNGPQEGGDAEYLVHFYWYGDDPDGTITYYEYVFSAGDPVGFNPADTFGLDKWTKISCTDTVFKMTADEYDSKVLINNYMYAKYSKTHTFFIRAVDNRGARSDAVYRSFTAWTLAPFIVIEEPWMGNPGHSAQALGPIIRFTWRGKDPIDSPWNYQEVDSIRYLWIPFTPGIVDSMNMHPEKFESMWSPWISYDAPGDSGQATVLGDDETLVILKTYIFAIQAMDEAGAITSIFDMRTNVRYFVVKEPTGPFLIVNEEFLGEFKFLGTRSGVKSVFMPSGYGIKFSWDGDASEYGSVVSSYRYGWDIANLENSKEWAVDPSPFHKSAPMKKFYSGAHTFYVEAVDNLGIKTLGQIEIQIFQIMERNLLWVDDFYSTSFVQSIYAYPTEQEHDNFWLGILSRAQDFQADRDIYDTAEHEFTAPDMRLLWKYKNIIWTYTATKPDKNIWRRMVNFVYYNGGVKCYHTMNMLSAYMSSGGHLWTLGKSDREGGIGASVGGTHMLIPINLKCEYSGPQEGCPDTLGAKSMGYRDYCITVLDRAWGPLRPDIDFAGWTNRTLDLDGMVRGYRDDSDPITAAHPDLPEELHLWERVTLPDMYFYPPDQGFSYFEIYDPAYWMNRKHLRSQWCFHPMYRVKTRSTRSSIDNAAFAIWITRYARIQPEAPGTVAAPSVHIGLPLWFFNRDEVNAIADAIFREWEISVYQ